MASHPSNSDEQQRTGIELVRRLSKQMDIPLHPKSLDIAGCTVQIDGYCDNPPVLCEAYAHIGGLKGSQPDKVLMDAFKMIFVEKCLGKTFRKILLLADNKVKARFTGHSWQAACLRDFGVEPIVIDLSARDEEEVRGAQIRQRR